MAALKTDKRTIWESFNFEGSYWGLKVNKSEQTSLCILKDQHIPHAIKISYSNREFIDWLLQFTVEWRGLDCKYFKFTYAKPQQVTTFTGVNNVLITKQKVV